ncbi:hypothetical protein ABK040_015636 [Willaertia magna]
MKSQDAQSDHNGLNKKSMDKNITLNNKPQIITDLYMKKYIFIILIGIIFHCVYMFSIFDIYFKSPIVHGMKSYNFDFFNNNILLNNNNITKQTTTQTNQFAKRLVFIVGDGLRADKFFEIVKEEDKMVGEEKYQLRKSLNTTLSIPPIYEGKYGLNRMETVAPFLRKKIETEASFGISHTRVPTESRPCHVAMIAGFYEDVSAVTTGWKENPVEFDSVFNQSKFVLQIGSPDVVNLFKAQHINTFHYPPEMEDFGSSDIGFLDRWVFDKFEYLLTHNETIKELLKQDKTIIFLHLLGIDTSGHAYRMGKGYYDSIRYVDNGVQKVYELISKFYNYDNETAFIFTADHGMSSRGSHGDGNPECTRTPLVCWGKGFRPFYEGKGEILSDGSFPSLKTEEKYVSSNWFIEPKYRKDIKQADMATLMSAVLGLSFPLNNVGTLPLAYLNMNERFRTINLFINARQVIEQFIVKQNMKQNQTLLLFRSYMSEKQINELEMEIKVLIEKESYIEAQEKIYELINIGLKGLNYFMTYDWPQLMSTVVIGYLFWMVYLLVFCLRHYTDIGLSLKSDGNSYKILSVAIPITLMLNIYLYLQNDPWHYHIYIIFPIYFFSYIANHIQLIFNFLKQNFSFTRDITSAFLTLLVLEVMVYGYYSRDIFSVCFIIIGVAPTLLGMSFKYRFGWLTTCIIMSLFTLLPPDYGSDMRLVIGGSLVFCGCQFLWRYIKPPKKDNTIYQSILFYFQLALVLVACAITVHTDLSLAKKQGLPNWNRIAAWVLSISSLFLPFFASNFYQIRAQSILSAFATPLVFLSINYEVLFYSGILVTFLYWIRHEKKKRKEDNNFVVGRLSSIEFSTALLFIFLFNMSFFGTGNLATISSFELSSVYRFISIFSPFTMTALLLIKLAIPLLAVTVTFVVIVRITGTPPFGSFLLVLSLCDIMTINFFFLVSDVGSWLEIGNSISRFAIGNAMIIILLLLFTFAQLYIRNVKVATKQD